MLILAMLVFSFFCGWKFAGALREERDATAAVVGVGWSVVYLAYLIYIFGA